MRRSASGTLPTFRAWPQNVGLTIKLGHSLAWAITIPFLQADALASTIARARDLQADALDDDIAGVIAEIRDSTLDPQAGRVIIWANQWRASKMRPKRYGDKIDHKLSGSLVIGIRQNDRVPGD